MLLGAGFGGLAFALYPLSVAHTNDHLTAAQRVGASGGLVLVYSVGAAAGPMAGAGAMMTAGPGGLFLFIGICGTMAFVTETPSCTSRLRLLVVCGGVSRLCKLMGTSWTAFPRT